MNRKKNYIRNIFWGVFSKIVMIILPFFVRTVLIYTLNINYVGLNTLFSTLLQVLSLAELGFGSALVYSMYKPVAENDISLFSKLLNYYKKIYKYIGIFILVVGLMLMPFLKYLINGYIPNDVNIYYLYLIYLFNTVFSYFFFSYRTSIFLAFQRVDVKIKIELIVNSMMYIFQIIVLFLFKNYYLYILLLPLSTIIINILILIKSRKDYSSIIADGELSIKEKKNIKLQVRNLIWHKLGNTIIFSFDSLVISSFLGLRILGIYNNYFYIYTAVASLFSIFYESITPGIGNSLITEDFDKNYNDFLIFGKINFILIGISSSLMLCLFQPFMFIWQGKELMLNDIEPILLVLLFIIWNSRRMIHTYKDSAGLWGLDKYRPVSEAMVNLILNILFVKQFGLIGVIIGTIISMCLVGIPWEVNRFIKHYFKRSILNYYKLYFIGLVKILFNCAICYFCCNLIASYSLFGFILRIEVCLLINLVILFFEYKNDNIFNLLWNIIRRKDV